MAVSAQVNSVAPEVVLANRRKNRRVRLSVPAVIWSAPEAGVRLHNERDSLHIAAIESLSSTGVALTCYGCFDEDDIVWIRFRIGSKTCQLKGIVRHSTMLSGSVQSRTRCGVEFVRCQQTEHATHVLSDYLE